MAAGPLGGLVLPNSFLDPILGLGCAAGICQDVSLGNDLKRKISPFFFFCIYSAAFSRMFGCKAERRPALDAPADSDS